MSLKHGLLGLLNYGAMTGYELSKGFDDSLGFFWQAQTSQIYRELNSMEKYGWLISNITFQTDKPNKRIYSITSKGKDELINWLSRDPLSSKFSNRNTFLMKVFFAGANKIDININQLYDFKNDCNKRLKNLEKAESVIDYYITQVSTPNDSIYWSSAGEFGKMYIKMCIEWVDKFILQLEIKKKEQL